jgi:hypothetical protein
MEQLSLYILIAVLWTIPWKGVALWRAAQRKELKWFIALLIINDLAIIEIIYIFFFSKKRSQSAVVFQEKQESKKTQNQV